MTVDYDEVLAPGQGGPAEADRLRRLRLPAHRRGRPLPRDRRRGRGALLMTDMAHFAGLVAAGLHPSPVPHCALRHLDDAQDARRPARRLRPLPRGARAGLDRAVFPGMQGGPLMHTIAAKAACFRIAATDAFKEYQRAGARERRHARGRADRRRLRRPHRRHRHPPRPARPARHRVDRPRGARSGSTSAG